MKHDSFAPEHGFTLIELAVVMAVVGLLLGSLAVPLATQVRERQIGEVRITLRNAREALIGFAIAHGRLPCPASAASSGIESPAGGGNCTNHYDGFLPAATLGIAPVDPEGFAVDPWGNRIRYAVTNANGSAFTTSNGVSTQFLTAPPTPNLRVCSTGVGASAGDCASGTAVTKIAPAVLLSLGPSGLAGGTGPDEAANLSNGPVFVTRLAGHSASGGDFDDVVLWLSPHTLYDRLVAAGRLP